MPIGRMAPEFTLQSPAPFSLTAATAKTYSDADVRLPTAIEVIGVAVLVVGDHVPPPSADQRTLYDVICEPPLLAGASHVTLAWSGPAVAVTVVT
jgi:hypothetical protein